VPSNPDPALAPELEELVRDLPPLVPLKDAADFLNVTDRTLRRWAAAGRLRVLKTSAGGSGRVLVPRTELVRILGEMFGIS